MGAKDDMIEQLQLQLKMTQNEHVSNSASKNFGNLEVLMINKNTGRRGRQSKYGY